MTIQGRVGDNFRKSSIQGATVSVIDEMGNVVAGPVVTDGVGGFIITSPAITLASSIEVKHPLFYPKELPLTGSTSQGMILLDPLPVVQSKPADLPDFQEKETPPASGRGSYWLLIIAVTWLLWPKPKGGRRKK